MACKECKNNKICNGAIDKYKESIRLIIAIAKKNNRECPIYKWR